MHIDNAVDDDTIIASMYMNNGLFNSIPLSAIWLAAGCPPLAFACRRVRFECPRVILASHPANHPALRHDTQLDRE